MTPPRVSPEQAAYYRSPAWRARRQVALDEAGNQCQACGRRAPKGLHAHHRYGRSKDLLDEHLVILCRPCHETVENLAARRSRLTPELLQAVIELARDKIRGPA